MFLRFTLIIVPLALLTIWYTTHVSPKDLAAFQKLSQESLELRTRNALEENPANQTRQEVQKDLWTQEREHHLQINCNTSELTIYQKKGKTGARETLNTVAGTIDQDTHFEAQSGLYTFPSHQFIAEDQCIFSYGENKISASQLKLDLLNETLHYKNPVGHLEKGLIDFEAQELVWDKKENKLYLHHDVKVLHEDNLTILSNQGVIELDHLTPKSVILFDNVRLLSSMIQNQQSYALADTLTYDPTNESILLSANKRVLFWQKGLSLSAPEVLLHKNKTVQGLGDVHFSFDLEEQNIIDQFFRQYL